MEWGGASAIEGCGEYREPGQVTEMNGVSTKKESGIEEEREDKRMKQGEESKGQASRNGDMYGKRYDTDEQRLPRTRKRVGHRRRGSQPQV